MPTPRDHPQSSYFGQQRQGCCSVNLAPGGSGKAHNPGVPAPLQPPPQAPDDPLAPPSAWQRSGDRIGGAFSKHAQSTFGELLAGVEAEHEREVSSLRAENVALRREVVSLRGGSSAPSNSQLSPLRSQVDGPSYVPLTAASDRSAPWTFKDGEHSLRDSLAELNSGITTLTQRLEAERKDRIAAFASMQLTRAGSLKRQQSAVVAKPEEVVAETKDRSEMAAPALHNNRLAQKPFMERLEIFLQSEKLEVTVLCLILFNTVIMAFEMQYQGLDVGYEINFPSVKKPASVSWPGAAAVFEILEYFFNVVFTVEVGTKILILRWRYLSLPMNWLDIFAVLVGSAEMILGGLMGNAVNPMVVRLLRLAKLERGLRMMKMSRILDTLSLLMKCLSASVTTLFWSLCLLLVIQCIAGMVLSQLVRQFLLTTDDEVGREKVYAYYGTFTRSMLTMFEVTLANWAPACRILVDHISEWYAAFFLFYRCIVGFAVLGVINAVFIQKTMETAGRDSEIMVARKKKEQEDYQRKLRQMFKQMDTSGDGQLSWEEFHEMMQKETMKNFMSALEIEATDARALFEMFVNEDGEMSYDQFIDGAMRIRGGAKSFDVVRLMSVARKIEGKLDGMVVQKNAYFSSTPQST